MFRKLVDELLEPARILRLQLLATGAGAVDRRKLLRPLGLPAPRHDLDLFAKLRGLVRLGAHAGRADHDAERSMRIVNAEMERGEPSHGKPHDVGFLNAKV